MTLNGNGLVAVIVLVVAIVVVFIVVARIIARDRMVRVSRIGWFVERERYDDNVLGMITEPDDEKVTEQQQPAWPKRDGP